MRCPKCNNEIRDGVLFCTVCGTKLEVKTSEEGSTNNQEKTADAVTEVKPEVKTEGEVSMPTESAANEKTVAETVKEETKKSKKEKVKKEKVKKEKTKKEKNGKKKGKGIIVLLIVLVILGVGGYFAYPYVKNFFDNSKFEKFIAAKDYDSAYEMLDCDPDFAIDLKNAVELDVVAHFNSYIEENETYTEATEAIKALGVYGYSVDDKITSISEIQNGRDNLALADSYFESGSYVLAMDLYKSVSELDTKYYGYSTFQSNLCYQNEIEEKKAEINKLAASSDIDDLENARKLISEYEQIYGKSDEMDEVFSKTVASEIAIFENKIDMSISSQDYIKALDDINLFQFKCESLDPTATVKANQYRKTIVDTWAPELYLKMNAALEAEDYASVYESAKIGYDNLKFDEVSRLNFQAYIDLSVEQVANESFDLVEQYMNNAEYEQAKTELQKIKSAFSDNKDIINRVDAMLDMFANVKEKKSLWSFDVYETNARIEGEVVSRTDTFGNVYSNALQFSDGDYGNDVYFTYPMPKGYNVISGTLAYSDNRNYTKGKAGILIIADDTVIYASDLFDNRHEPVSFKVAIPAETQFLTVKFLREIGSSGWSLLASDFVLSGEPVYIESAEKYDSLRSLEIYQSIRVGKLMGVTDLNKNTYADAFVFDWIYNEDNEMTYLVNNRYNRFTCTLGLANSSRNEKSSLSSLSIYADDNLIYTSPTLKNYTNNVFVDVEIGLCQQLKFVMNNDGDRGRVFIADAKLYKNEE